MALRALQGPTGGGAPVGGGGTSSPSTIPRWTGASTLGDSGLIDDGTQVYTTTRKLAVGSASAVSELTAVTGAVAPTANPPALQTLHGNNQNVFRAKYTSTNFNVSGNWLGLGLGYHDNYMKAAIIAEAKDGTGRASMHIALNAATTAANVGLADARLTVTYDGNVGIGTASPAANLHVYKASGVGVTVESGSGTVAIPLSLVSPANTLSMNNRGDISFSLLDSSAYQLGIRTLAAQPIFFATNGTERARIDSNGNVVINTAAIATNATNGFLYVPSCAGTPTGTPTTYTGRVPIVVDTTNNKLYFYSGGAWRDAGP